MSQRSLLEINHDLVPSGTDEKTLMRWAQAMAEYSRAGDPKALPNGVTFYERRHHADPFQNWIAPEAGR